MFGEEVSLAPATEATGLSDPSGSMPGLPRMGQTRLGFTHPQMGLNTAFYGEAETSPCQSHLGTFSRPCCPEATWGSPNAMQLPRRRSLVAFSSLQTALFPGLHTACTSACSHTAAASPNTSAQL